MTQVVILIPSYDEYENLKILLPKIKSSILKNFNNFETSVLIIDKVEKNIYSEMFVKKFKFIYLNRLMGNSFGDAIRSGINFIEKNMPNTDWVIMMDSDCSHDPSLFSEFAKQIKFKKFDLVIASRYIYGGSTENNKILIALSKLLNFTYKLFFKLNIKDVSNSYRLYRYEYLSKIELIENNFEIIEEILLKIVRKFPKVKILEIPSTFHYRIYGKSKRNLFLFALSYIASISRLRKYLK